MTFEDAAQRAMTGSCAVGGIGTLQEKCLHATLKWWLDEEHTHHEIPLPQGPIADIFDGQRVTEIQTAGFSAFRKKLEKLLDNYPTTVVHPLVREKYVVWVDPLTGEATAPRKSPRRGGFADAGGELVFLLPCLSHKNLTIRLVLLDVEERRLADGYGKGGKRHSHRLERRPLALVDTLTLQAPADYAALIPATLPTDFTAKQFGKATRLQGRRLSGTLKVLAETGALRKERKEGRSWIYRRA